MATIDLIANFVFFFKFLLTPFHLFSDLSFNCIDILMKLFVFLFLFRQHLSQTFQFFLIFFASIAFASLHFWLNKLLGNCIHVLWLSEARRTVNFWFFHQSWYLLLCTFPWVFKLSQLFWYLIFLQDETISFSFVPLWFCLESETSFFDCLDFYWIFLPFFLIIFFQLLYFLPKFIIFLLIEVVLLHINACLKHRWLSQLRRKDLAWRFLICSFLFSRIVFSISYTIFNNERLSQIMRCFHVFQLYQLLLYFCA